MAATMNTKPQLTAELKAIIAKQAEKVGNSQHPDGPITIPNVEVVNKDDGMLSFVVDLSKVAFRTDKVARTMERKVEKNGKEREVGGNLVLAQLIKMLPQIKLPVLDNERFDIHAHVMLTVSPK